MKPEVTRKGVLDMQVCVPTNWDDEMVVDFANISNLCGTAHGWSIRRNGSEWLNGAPERNPCHERDGFVHIMLDA